MELSKENILVNTNGGLDVFEYFISSFPGINKAFFNPFYKDTKASCYVFRDPGSMIVRLQISWTLLFGVIYKKIADLLLR